MFEVISRILFPGPVHVAIDSEGRVREIDSAHHRDELESIHPKISKGIDLSINQHYTNPTSAYNLGIFSSYFAVGVVSRFHQTPVQYYLIHELGASAAQYSAYVCLHRLPWSLKVFSGMLSDGVPILGYRRKAWLVIGWLGFSLCNLSLCLLGSPGIMSTVLMVFLFTCFLVTADVNTDTLSVERSKLEPSESRGNLQSIGFTYRAFGRIIGAIMGTYLYDNGKSWSFTISQVYLLQMTIPVLIMTAFFWTLIEFQTSLHVPSFFEQLNEIWKVLQLESVWKPMIFIYSFGVFQIANPAWSNFLVHGLDFTDEDLGYLQIFASVIGFLVMRCFRVSSHIQYPCDM